MKNPIFKKRLITNEISRLQILKFRFKNERILLPNYFATFILRFKGTPWDETFSMLSILKI